MVALLVRLTILFGVLFGAAFGIAKAIRGRSNQKAIADIEKRLTALKAGDHLWSPEERDALTQDIVTKCKNQGIPVPKALQKS